MRSSWMLGLIIMVAAFVMVFLPSLFVLGPAIVVALCIPALISRRVHTMQMSKRKRRIVLATVAALYVITWVGGRTTLWHELNTIDQHEALMVQEEREWWLQHLADVQAMWDEEEDPRWNAGLEKSMADSREKLQYIDDGPHARVPLCVPLLPFVFVASYGRSLAPLSGRGRISIFLWYGIGTVELAYTTTWIS